MLVRRISPISGKRNSMNLNITESQVDDYEAGMLLQHAFPNLSADEREFFKTGITSEEWDSMFSEDEK